MTTGLVVALLLPVLAGTMLLGLGRSGSSGNRAIQLGYGSIFGVLLTVALLVLMDTVGLKLSFVPVVSVLSMLIVATGVWQWRTAVGSRSGLPSFHLEMSGWLLVLSSLLLVLILLRLLNIALEVYWRPLYPWDAWTTWAVKARVWFENRALSPFVDGSVWLQQPGEAYTIAAWQYPKTVPLISTWTALGLGYWESALVNLPWLVCGMALLLAFYGQARAWGVPVWLALIFVYFLISLPLLDTHIALAGYADLWLATCYALAGMAFLQWARTGDRYQASLAVIFAFACCFIKQEGLIWALTLIPALLVARLRWRWLLVGLLLIVLAVGFTVLTAGINISIPGMDDRLILSLQRIQVPGLGQFEIGFSDNWQPLIDNLLILDNWHLLGYGSVLVLLFGGRRIVSNRVLLSGAVLLMIDLGLLYFLFFLTAQSAWAKDYSAFNRLLLQLTPLLLFYLLIVVKAVIDRRSVPAVSGTDRPVDGQSQQYETAR